MLIELDPEIEARNKDRAKSDLKIAETQLDDARNRVDDAMQQILVAESTLEDLEAVGDSLKPEFERVQRQKDSEENTYSKMDYIQRKSNYDRNLAQQKGAKARLKQAGFAVTSAELRVVQQIETVSKFRKILDDAEERLRDTTIRAPRDGIVTAVSVSIGAKIQSGVSSMTGGTVLLSVADVSTLEVLARVDEADWGKIADIAPVDALPDIPGNRDAARRDADLLEQRSGRVKIEVDAFPGEIFEGIVRRVEPQGRATGGATVIQFAVHVEITDAQRNKLPLGAQAQVTFTVESKIDALRVPVDAVKSQAGKSGVWIPTPPPPGRQGKGKKFIPCDFTISDGEFVVVEQSDPFEFELKAGQEVYTKLPPNRDKDEG